MIKNFNNKKLLFISGLITASILFALGSIPVLFAEQMSSSNYKIQFDSLNVGGKLSSSTNYLIEDTVGEIATGLGESSSYKLQAGYQQMHLVYLSMTAASNVAMSPTIDLSTGGTSNGSTNTTATTDSAAGYELYVKASSSPAMQGNTSSGTISNYTPNGSGPDFTFSVASTAAEFGFTPEGNDITSEYKDDGVSLCNTGATSTADTCWNPVTTTNELISQRTSGNHPNGTQTTLKFKLTVGSASTIVADTYTATTTLTVIAL